MSDPRPKPASSGTPASASPLTELDARRLGPVRRWFATHPVGTDRVVIAIFLAATALALTISEMPESRWWVIAGSLLVAAALLRRRHAPVVVALVVSVIGTASILAFQETAAYDLGAAFAVYAVAASRPARIAWPTLGAATLLLAGACLVAAPTGTMVDDSWVAVTVPRGSITADRIITAGFVVVVLLIAMSIGSTVRGRRIHIADLVDRANSFAREADQQARLAAITERARIAREMHDVVAHSLTVMVALADGAKALGLKDPELAGRALDELTETGRTALTDMRSVLGILRDPRDVPPGETPTALPDLEDVVESFRTAGLPVRLVRSGGARDLPTPVRRAVDRIVTEALTNVMRHAPLSPEVRVTLGGVWTPEGPGRSVEVTVRNTHGARPGEDAPGVGHGIVGMRERATALGGSVEAGPHGSGWQVRAILPIKEDT